VPSVETAAAAPDSVEASADETPTAEQTETPAQTETPEQTEEGSA